MSGRSPSGVASLRARFEHNSESTSPPSRGRSPAGSARSDTSRPISKVRTSFVSVEGSGIMSDQSKQKENETVVSEGKEGSREATNGAVAEKPQANGEPVTSPEHVETSIGKDAPKLGNVEVDPTDGRNKPTALDGTSDANPDKPVSNAGDNAAVMPATDPKDEVAVSDRASLTGDAPELGSILKGSPFEQNGEKKASQSEPLKPQTEGPKSSSQPPKSQSKPSASGLVNGKPKDAPGSTLGAQLKPKASGSDNPSQAKATPASTPSDGPAASEKKTLTPAPQDAVETKPAGAGALPAVGESVKDKPVETNHSEPQNPKNTADTAKQPAPSKASPKLFKPKEPKKEISKNVKDPIGRPSMISKMPPAAASKSSSTPTTSTAKPLKKQGPTSPKTTFTKPRPKSPTRPQKLPAAATAPTAASAAKLDGLPPSTNDRKPISHAPTQKRVSSNPTKPHPRPVRTSLPVGSKLDDKPKASRSRQSMASTRAPEGSFLDRMMRPTQSSSQKTHEKVEVKTPPKKQSTTRLKRTSEGSNKSKSESADVRTELAEEPSVLSNQPPIEANESSDANGANHSASVAAHTTPTTIPVP